MSFFPNLNKILKPEMPESAEKAPISTVKPVNPGDLDMDAIKLAASAHVNSSKAPVSLSEAVKAQKSEQKEIVEPVVEVIEAESPSIAPEIESPIIIPEIVIEKPMVEEVVEVKKVETEKTEINVNKGREFVDAFLNEINDYLAAGKELETLIKTKEGQKNILSEEQVGMRVLEENGNTIKEALQSFLEAHNDEAARAKLTEVINSYNEYKKTFNQIKQEVENKGLKLSNETLVKINAKKGEISKLINGLGNSENVQAIMDYIRKAERVASRYNQKNGEIKIAGVESAINTLVINDLNGAKMFLEGNDLTGLLMRIFQQTENSKMTAANDNTQQTMRKAA